MGSIHRVTLGALALSGATLAFAASMPGTRSATHPAQPGSTASGRSHTAPAAYGRLPLAFASAGSGGAGSGFEARGPGYSVRLAPNRATLAVQRANRPEAGSLAIGCGSPRGCRVGVELVGANPVATGRLQQPLPEKINILRGSDPARWRLGLPTAARVEFRSVYPGIDVAYYGRQQQLEYDFMLAPQADPGHIRLRFTGLERLDVDDHGDLLLRTRDGVLKQEAPVAYQQARGERTPVTSQYVVDGPRSVRLALGDYDHNRPLVIDPVVKYSTYLGGTTSTTLYGVAVDGSGDAYVVGNSASIDYPTQNALQTDESGTTDVVVTKLNAAGTGLVFSTYLGGSGTEDAYGIAVDAKGNAYVAGDTGSSDFPTKNAFQSTSGAMSTGFVSKLSKSGALVYSTYLGGSSNSSLISIAVDSTGSAYVAGGTLATDYPVKNAVQSTNHGSADVVVTKLTPKGNALTYSTYFGGTSIDESYLQGIAVDSHGQAYITGFTTSTNFPVTAGAFQQSSGGGQDGFVLKLAANGRKAVYSTYLGGSGTDYTLGVAADATGNAYVAGTTGSSNFPTRLGGYQTLYGGGSEDGFIAKLNPKGTSLIYSTFLGGSDDDLLIGLALDSQGRVYASGQTKSNDFPSIPSYTPLGGYDALLVRLNKTGSHLDYTVYLGGTASEVAYDVALDKKGAVYLAGQTGSSNFPVGHAYQPTNRGAGSTGFVTKLQ